MRVMDIPYRAFLAAAASTPHATFLHLPRVAQLPYAPKGATFTYGEAEAQVEELRRLYAAAGYGYRATVALLIENRPAFFWHGFALNALGLQFCQSIRILSRMISRCRYGHAFPTTLPMPFSGARVWKIWLAGPGESRSAPPTGSLLITAPLKILQVS
jgi:hypothetical protein